jgi:hypothetical protein
MIMQRNHRVPVKMKTSLNLCNVYARISSKQAWNSEEFWGQFFSLWIKTYLVNLSICNIHHPTEIKITGLDAGTF